MKTEARTGIPTGIIGMYSSIIFLLLDIMNVISFPSGWGGFAMGCGGFLFYFIIFLLWVSGPLLGLTSIATLIKYRRECTAAEVEPPTALWFLVGIISVFLGSTKILWGVYIYYFH